MEIKFCRRCGATLTKLSETSFTCSNGHTIFCDPSPTVAAVVITADGKVALTVRARDPHKGMHGLLGGFVDANESLEQALVRELKEEAGLEPADYLAPQFISSAPDIYAWEGNGTRVLGANFLVRLKPGAVLKPADDVADIVYFEPDGVPFETIALPSLIVAIKGALKVL